MLNHHICCDADIFDVTVSLHVTTGGEGEWVKSMWNCSIIFLGNNMLLISYKSIIISKYKNLKERRSAI